MDAWGMTREALQIDDKHPTGSNQAMLYDGELHYEIVENCAFDFIDEALLEEGNAQGILYHGSLAARNPIARAALHGTKCSTTLQTPCHKGS